MKLKVLFRQGIITFALITAFTFVVFYSLSFNGYDLIWLQNNPLEFIQSGIKGYAAIMLIGLWLFTLLAFFFPIIIEESITSVIEDWSEEYPLWKEEFRSIEQGKNHPNLFIPDIATMDLEQGKDQLNANASVHINKIVLSKTQQEEEDLDKLLKKSKLALQENLDSKDKQREREEEEREIYLQMKEEREREREREIYLQMKKERERQEKQRQEKEKQRQQQQQKQQQEDKEDKDKNQGGTSSHQSGSFNPDNFSFS